MQKRVAGLFVSLVLVSASLWAEEPQEAAPLPERKDPALVGPPLSSKSLKKNLAGKDLCKQNFDAYKERLRKNPEDAEGWSELRVCADLLKRWGEAGAIASAAIEKKINRAEPHLILGQAYYQAKDFAHAIDEFQEAVRIKGDLAQAYFYMGLAHLHMSQPSDAVKAGVRAAELDPGNSAYHRQLAFSYYMIKEDEKCEIEAKKAIDIDVNDVAAYKILGNLYTRQGKLKEADHMLEEAIHANGRIAAASPFVPDKRLSEFEMPQYFQPATPPSDTEVFLKAQWEKMKQAAREGMIPQTLMFYSTVGETRESYRQAFDRMGTARMNEVYGKLGTLSDCEIDVNSASANCRCPVTGSSGMILETKVRFRKDPDAIWRIVSF